MPAFRLYAGMERAGFAAPGKRAVMHQQVGNHVIYMMSPPDGKDIINMNRLKCKHAEQLVNCRVEHKDYPQETMQVQRTLKPTSRRKPSLTRQPRRWPLRPLRCLPPT